MYILKKIIATIVESGSCAHDMLSGAGFSVPS